MGAAKKLIKQALKAAPKHQLELSALEQTVVAQLVADGLSERKAAKQFASKLELPAFVRSGKVVRLAKGDDEAPTEAPSKRALPAAEDATPRKKNKKGADGAPDAPAGSGALGECKMMSAAAATAFWNEHRIQMNGDDADHFRPLVDFADAGFHAAALKAVAGFAKPTPIQACCWPVLMAGRDVVGVAETGSGKTLAFFLPAMMHIAAMPEPAKGSASSVSVLVLAPTRELAMQSEAVCRAAGTSIGLGSICVYGGVPKGPQRQAIKDGARVVVATPGRLLDLHEEGAVGLGGVSYLVLDEADRMLDMGFEKDVRAIIGLTSAARRTAMFTATWPDSVRTLAEEFLNRPVRVNVGSEDLAANTRVSQTVEVIDESRKPQRLTQLLQKYHSSRKNRVLVFALYKKEAARIEQDIKRAGYAGIAIHGDMTQDARTRALQQFKEGSVPLLVATDVAARGLDIPDVEVVINYTFPLTIEDYVHRIGRTGRGGKSGISHTLFTGNPQFEKPLAGALQNVLREAGQPVPDELLRFGSTVKKKEHKMYGAFASGGAPMKQATKIVFD
jgi:ATP-dependent RNA helicase DBP3